MKNALLLGAALACVTAVVTSATASGAPPGLILEGKRLFEQRDVRRQRPHLPDLP